MKLYGVKFLFTLTHCLFRKAATVRRHWYILIAPLLSEVLAFPPTPTQVVSQ